MIRIFSSERFSFSFLGLTFGAWLLLFTLFLISWLYGPQWLFLHYDGDLTSWSSRAMVEWAEPFELEPLNPFNAMGGSFLSVNPWLSPGQLALTFSDWWRVSEILSMAVFWVLIAVSSYHLLRELGLNRLYATVATQTGLLLTFPTYAIFALQFPQQALVPIFAQSIIVLNLIGACYLKIGKHGPVENLVWAAAIFVLLAIGIFSMPMTTLAFGQSYFFLLLVFTLLDPGMRKRLLRVGFGLSVLALAYFVGLFDFIFILLESAARNFFLTGYEREPFLSGLDQWRVCQFHANSQSPSSYSLPGSGCLLKKGMIPQYLAILGALYVILRMRGPLRAFAAGFCAIYVWAYAHMYLSAINWWDIEDSGGGHLTFIMAPAMQFVAAFFVISFFHIAGSRSLSLAVARASALSGRWARYAFDVRRERVGLGATWAAIAVVLVVTLWLGRSDIVRFFDGQPARGNENHTFEVDSKLVTHLEREISLVPGARFRGSVTTFFGSETSPVAKHLSLKDDGRDFVRTQALWDYYEQNYGLRFWGTDFGYRKIPIIEDYNQFTPPLFAGLASFLLSDIGDRLYPNYIILHRLRPRHLQAFGARFLITDTALTIPSVSLTMKDTRPRAFPIYLYEFNDPNLGQYSPTEVSVSRRIPDIFRMMSAEDFDPRQQVILTSPLDEPLIPAASGKMWFRKGGIRVEARSDGQSLLLLPVNFSHCWRVVEGADVGNIRLRRGNLVHLALVFEGTVSASLERKFQVGNMECRVRDAEEQEQMGIDFFTLDRWTRVR